MKIAIVLLLIVSVVHCSSQCEDVSEYFSGIKDIVCPLWSGWGMAFANETCSKTISSSCDKIFDIIPKLIEFFTTFDMKKIMELLGDLYGVIKGVYDQFTDCKYIEYFLKFFQHIGNFIKNISENFQKISTDVFGFISAIKDGQYYQAGLFLGHIFWVIIAS